MASSYAVIVVAVLLGLATHFDSAVYSVTGAKFRLNSALILEHEGTVKGTIDPSSSDEIFLWGWKDTEYQNHAKRRQFIAAGADGDLGQLNSELKGLAGVSERELLQPLMDKSGSV